ncbi:Endo/exonuclease/phosphatase domain-containing protein [Aphelenchoides fujianensis]|nr:Endo/exonuclease/phosphatase domain-containing protein [Aphelenchoides fujianensis]
MTRFLLVSLLFLLPFVVAKPRIDNRTPTKDGWWDAQKEKAARGVAGASGTSGSHWPTVGSFKVFTMNTWVTGSHVNDGVQKIADQIVKINADIVAIQELSNRTNLAKLAAILAPDWQLASTSSDGAIISRHPIDETYKVDAGTGARMLINGTHPVHVYSMHLAYRSYGPYLAINKNVKNVSLFDLGESFGSWSRYNNIANLLKDATFRKWNASTADVPLILAGDFNSPSHLDWTAATKEQHGDWVYRWPATALLQSEGKLVDSFRERHPDPRAEPGITWSTYQTAYSTDWNYQLPEPQDRIDFIFYKSPALTVRDSYVYADEFQPQPAKPDENVWPSDHYAVITEFEWRTR